MSDGYEDVQGEAEADLSQAIKAYDHYENFDEHKAEAEAGEREWDKYLQPDMEDQGEVLDSWQQNEVLEVDKKIIIEVMLAFQGPTAWVEITCYEEDTPHGPQVMPEKARLITTYAEHTRYDPLHDEHPLYLLACRAAGLET